MSIESVIKNDLKINFGSFLFDSESYDNMYKHARNLINFYDLRCDICIWEDGGYWQMCLEWPNEETEMWDRLKWKAV